MPGPGRKFKKGVSGNPGGKPKSNLRLVLEKDADDIHEALMKLVRALDAKAVIYAHQQVFGKPPQRVELTGANGQPLETRSELKVEPLEPSRISEIVNVLGSVGALSAGAAEEGVAEADDAEVDEVCDAPADGASGGVSSS